MKLIFDIGCNQGDFFTTAISKHRDAKVVAVDANPDFIHDHPNPKVSMVHAAMSGESDQELELFIDDTQLGVTTASRWWMEKSRYCAGNKYLHKKHANWNRSIKVKTKTIEDLVSKYGSPDFIKIDVEGLELQVIKGMSEKHGMIGFEFTEEGVEDAIACVNRLSFLGYTEFGAVGYYEDMTGPSNWITYSKTGDGHMVLPDSFFAVDTFKSILTACSDVDRAITWGMIYAK